MSHDVTHWSGEPEDKGKLEGIVAAWCKNTSVDGDHCQYHQGTESLKSVCQAHMMLVRDQRALDGLAFLQAKLEMFRAEEWSKERRLKTT